MSLDTAGLLETLRQHALLPPERLHEAVAMQGRFADPRDLLRELVRRGWLTPLQANRVLQGRAGELVLGQYVLQEQLGEGGMGQVFRAWQRRLDRFVALKLIRPHLLEKASTLQRFLREAKAAARLSHVNIVLVHDADEMAGTHFLVMELIEGTNLARLMQTQGPLPSAQACDFIRQAALGLQHVHEKGLVHRDIKPQNLLVTNEGVIKVADFGLAGWKAEVARAMADSVTAEGTVMGTSDFMAPEQARDAHNVDIRADLYSLGCTLYYLLSGRVPFPGGTLTDKLLRHQQDEPEPVERLRANLPPDLPPLLSRLMAKRPEHRFATPAEAAAALAAIAPVEAATTVSYVPARPPDALGAETGVVMETTADRVPSRSARRKRILVPATAAVAVVLIGLISFLLFRRDKPDAAPDTNPPVSANVELPPLAAEERFDWQPKELVAVLGEHRLRHWSMIHRVAFSPDGRELASAGGDTVVRLWDPATGKQQRELPGQIGAVFTVSYSPDDRLLASAGEEVVRLWDRRTGTVRHPLNGHRGVIRACAFDSTSKHLATGGDDRTVRLWDTTTGTQEDILRDHSAEVTAVVFSPDDKLLAVGCADRTTHLYRVGTKEALTVWKDHDNAVMTLAFSRDGKLLASGGEDGKVLLTDMDQKQVIATHRMEGAVRGVAFSADGKTLAASAISGQLQLWDVATRKPGLLLKAASTLNSVAFSPTEELIAAAGDGERVYLWDSRTGKERFPNRGHTGPVWTLAFHPGGQLLASGGQDGTLRLWEIGPEVREKILESYELAVYALAFQPSGKLLASATGYESVHLWDTSTWKVQSQLAKENNEALPSCLTFSTDGQKLAVAIRKPIVRVWDVADKKNVAHLHKITAEAQGVAFAPDDKTLAIGDGDWQTDGSVKLWKWQSGDEPISLPTQRLWVRRVAYAPDGRTLASAGADAVVRIWDAKSQQLQAEGKIPQGGPVQALVYAPDGHTLASAGVDGRIILWEPATAEQQHEWRLPGEVRSLAFHPNSRLLAAGNENGTIYLLRLPERSRVD